MSIGTIIRARREEMGLTQDQVSVQVDISKPYLSNIETGKAKNPPTDGILRSLERVLKFDTDELIRMAHEARTPADVREANELRKAEVEKLRNVLGLLITKVSPQDLTELNLDTLSDSLGRKSNIQGLSAGVAIPIINKVAAGYPSHFTDLDYPPSVADDYVRCPDMHDPQAFAAHVVGDSMEPEYHEGDIVVFSPNAQVHAGDDCFIRFEADGGTTFKRFYQDSQTTVRLQPLNSKYPAETYDAQKVTGLWPAVFRILKLRR